MAQLGFSFEARILRIDPERPAPPPPRRRPKVPVATARVAETPSGAQLSWLEHGHVRSISLPQGQAPRPVAVPIHEAATPPRQGRTRKSGADLRLQTALERHLKDAIGAPVLISFTDNTSTMISFKRRGRAYYLRIHRMFGEAPPPVIAALGAFVTKDKCTAREAKLLDDWIEAHRGSLNSARADALKPQPFGEVYDLVAIFQDLNQRYFAGKIDAQITWTRAAKNQRRTSIHMGTYSDELRLIRIHPALDQAWVPKFFVEFVVFHEMLHQVHQVGPHRGGRREVHSRAFRRDEARFFEYREARAWERQNLRRLLRY